MTRREILPMPLPFAAEPPLCCDTADLPLEAVRFSGSEIRVDLSRAPALALVGGAVVLNGSTLPTLRFFAGPMKPLGDWNPRFAAAFERDFGPAA